MTKIEEIRATGTRGFAAFGQTRSPKVVSIAGRDRAGELDLGETRRFALGRKGRRERTRRRLIDGAFITAALATAVVLWWTSL